MVSGDRGVTRRPSKKAAAKTLGDSCSTSPERNRKDDVVGSTVSKLTHII